MECLVKYKIVEEHLQRRRTVMIVSKSHTQSDAVTSVLTELRVVVNAFTSKMEQWEKLF